MDRNKRKKSEKSETEEKKKRKATDNIGRFKLLLFLASDIGGPKLEARRRGLLMNPLTSTQERKWKLLLTLGMDLVSAWLEKCRMFQRTMTAGRYRNLEVWMRKKGRGLMCILAWGCPPSTPSWNMISELVIRSDLMSMSKILWGGVCGFQIIHVKLISRVQLEK